MTPMRPVPFAEFRAFLERLGYAEKRVPKGRVFEHPTEGLLLFRFYRDQDTVHPRDLLSTRSFLDLRGVIRAEEYDAQLLRANTPA
jgi:hypothetical protein